MAYYTRLSYDHKHQWRVPSGEQGKSTNPNIHEHLYGFGFEEWNFNVRRFKDETGGQAHFAYIQAFNRAQPPDESQDLVLYTLRSNGRRVVSRYVVAKLKAGSWRFIDNERYTELKRINTTSIQEMRAELQTSFQQGLLRNGLHRANVLRRFDQQKNCRDWHGQDSDTFRLWNIEFLKPVKLLMQEVSLSTTLPDSHIKKIQRFNLVKRV